jgi:choline dehydrogenase-like flavoprotein
LAAGHAQLAANMLIDSRDLPQDGTRHYDLCIIGAGAAGITLARALRGENLSIGLLESGGFSYEAGTQALYDGLTSGAGLSRTAYLSTSRLRFFGGTTNHWGGWCLPLDPMDFLPRPWVPHSGWPITRADLAPYYERAAEVVQIPPFSDEEDERRGREDQPILDRGLLITKRLYTSPPTRFGSEYREEVVGAERIELMLHANVTSIDLDDDGSRVTNLRVATLSGRRFSVTARMFVLAAGAIENARLLLMSDAVHKDGVGNQSGAVGRYFMEHPECPVGYVFLTDRRDALRTYQVRRARMSVLCLSEEAQRRYELLNASFQLGPTDDLPLSSEAGGVPLAIGRTVRAIDSLGARAASRDGNDTYTRCYVRAEAAPSPASRVTLVRETDALGMRRVSLRWSLGTLESRTIQYATELVARELGRARRGGMLLLYDEDAGKTRLGQPPWKGVHGGSHHMGTTRMSVSRNDGVVDANSRVHSVANLYIAGSSVFPTVGFANPTFTIVALTLRLADHLRSRAAQA